MSQGLINFSGAELINALIERRLKAEEEVEDEIVCKIKQKMDKIRTTQKERLSGDFSLVRTPSGMC